jgi:hypothetical protein
LDFEPLSLATGSITHRALEFKEAIEASRRLRYDSLANKDKTVISPFFSSAGYSTTHVKLRGFGATAAELPRYWGDRREWP